MQLGGEHGQGRRLAVHDDRGELVGHVGDPVAVEAQHLRRLLHRPDDRSGEDLGTDGVELELELGDDAEVPPGPADAPEQVAVLLGAGLDQLPVGGDQVHRQQLVDGQAVLAHQPADAAAQGEPGQPGVGHDARRHGQPEGLGLPVELAQPDPRLRPHRPAGQVDPHALHQGEVDHQPVVAHRQAGKAVAAASDRHGEPDPASEADGVDDVGHAGAAGDERRVPVDRTVPHPPMGS